MKVVIDTNIFVAIIGKKSPYRWIFESIIKGSIKLCISNEILAEYEEILSIKSSPEVAENIVNFIVISPFTQKIEPYFKFQLITHDEDDNKFADCAVTANADCLLSNDSHFQELKSIDFPIVTILTLAEFEKLYKNNF